MTAASPTGTPLFISELSLVISLLAAVGWIATALTARLNLQRQIRVASREAWMREFREKVAELLSKNWALRAHMKSRVMDIIGHERRPDLIAHETRRVDLNDARGLCLYSISLLLDERGLPEEGFGQLLAALQNAKDDDTAGTAQIAVLKETGIILRRERTAIEAGRWWPWVAQQLRAWLHRILTPPSRW
jgi:hypothetical protein